MELTAFAFDVVGDLAYVAAGVGGIAIVDVSDPGQLQKLGQSTFSSPRSARDIAAAPPIALVGDSEGFRVASVADPANPAIVADPLVAADSVEIDGSVGYVAAFEAGLQTWDLSNPTEPALLGSVPGLEWIDLKLADGLAYATGIDPLTDEVVFAVVDVRDPDAPTEIGRTPVHDDFRTAGFMKIAVTGTVAYVLLAESVVVVEVSDPMTPVPLGSFRVCRGALSIEASRARLFAGTECGLSIFDLADPFAPFELAMIEANDTWAVAVIDRIALLRDFYWIRSYDLGVTLAPEPGALAASGAAAGALAWWARRRARGMSGSRRYRQGLDQERSVFR